jgi:aspartate aminotransferase
MTDRAIALRAEGRDIISLSVGEPDFPTPPHVIEAAKAALDAGDTRYTAVPGTAALRDAAALHFARDLGIQVPSSQVIVSAGGKQAIFLAIAATAGAGDEVLIPAPWWVSYPEIVRFAGAEPVVIPTTPATGYRISAAQLEAAISPNARWLLLNSPGNPTGAVYSADDLAALGDVLRRHPQVLVLSDDIYAPLRYGEGAHATLAAQCPDLADRVLTVSGVSKSHAMTGFRIGVSAGPAWLIGAMAKLQSHASGNPCSISQYAVLAALNGPQDFLRERNIAFRERRDLVVAMLNDAPGLSCPTPEGAFYVYPDATGVMGKKTPQGKIIQTDADLIDYFLDEYRVAAVHGGAFGLSPGFRISYATSADILKEACLRIQAACAALT